MFFEIVKRRTGRVSVFFGKKSFLWKKNQKIRTNGEIYKKRKNLITIIQKNIEKLKIYLEIKKKENKKKRNEFLLKPYSRIQVIKGVSWIGNSEKKKKYEKLIKGFKCQNNLKQIKEPMMPIYKNTLQNLKGFKINHQEKEEQGFKIKTFDKKFIFLISGTPLPLHFKYPGKGSTLKKKNEKIFHRYTEYFSSFSFLTFYFQKFYRLGRFFSLNISPVLKIYKSQTTLLEKRFVLKCY